LYCAPSGRACGSATSIDTPCAANRERQAISTCSIRDSGLYCASTQMRPISELTRLLRTKSTMRRPAAKGSAGLRMLLRKRMKPRALAPRKDQRKKIHFPPGI
jgi:hypothetical protein